MVHQQVNEIRFIKEKKGVNRPIHTQTDLDASVHTAVRVLLSGLTRDANERISFADKRDATNKKEDTVIEVPRRELQKKISWTVKSSESDRISSSYINELIY